MNANQYPQTKLNSEISDSKLVVNVVDENSQVKKLTKKPSIRDNLIENRVLHKVSTDGAEIGKRNVKISSNKDESRNRIEKWIENSINNKTYDDDVFEDDVKVSSQQERNDDKFNKNFKSSTKQDRINSNNKEQHQIENQDKETPDKLNQIKRSNSNLHKPIIMDHRHETSSHDNRILLRVNSKEVSGELHRIHSQKHEHKPTRLEKVSYKENSLNDGEIVEVKKEKLERVNSIKPPPPTSQKQQTNHLLQPEIVPLQPNQIPLAAISKELNSSNQKLNEPTDDVKRNLQRMNSKNVSKYLKRETPTGENQVQNPQIQPVDKAEVQVVQRQRLESKKKVEKWLEHVVDPKLEASKNQQQQLKPAVSYDDIHLKEKSEDKMVKPEKWLSTSSLDKKPLQEKEEPVKNTKIPSESVTSTSENSSKTEAKLTKEPKNKTSTIKNKQKLIADWLKNSKMPLPKNQTENNNETKNKVEIENRFKEQSSVESPTGSGNFTDMNSANKDDNTETNLMNNVNKKRKSYRKRICVLSVIISLTGIFVLATTIALLVKYVGGGTTTTTTTNSYIKCEIKCPIGYTAISHDDYCECGDLNECLQISNYCLGTGALCTNTYGSYICSCQAGFQLDSNKTACRDINECLNFTSSPCDTNNREMCVNTIGSYKCICNSGYEWSNDLAKCIDINECSRNSNKSLCNINEICVNTVST